MKKNLTKLLTATLLAALGVSCTDAPLTVKSRDIEITLSRDGVVESAYFPEQNLTKSISAQSELEGCEVLSVERRRVEGGVEFEKSLRNSESNQMLTLTERFTPNQDGGVHWSVKIEGDGEEWTTPISTAISYPAGEGVTHWMPWADPRGDLDSEAFDSGAIADGAAGAAGIDEVMDKRSWVDPLIELPLRDAYWCYGAPIYTYEVPNVRYCPFEQNVITMPMISYLEEGRDFGFSLVLSVEDTMLDIDMTTTKEGGATFSRHYHRLGGGNVVEFNMDLIAHQADWRASYGWVVDRYSDYFIPANPLANEIAGTGGYSNSDNPFDVEKMHKMAFSLNWRASFDFPYMGMFVPTEDESEEWSSFDMGMNSSRGTGRPMSLNMMEGYCKKMDDFGFHVLSYFNVTEFGSHIDYPRPASLRKAGDPEWIDSNDYLFDNFEDAILFVPEQEYQLRKDKSHIFYLTHPESPYFTWERAAVMDPGVKSYSDHLVRQAELTVKHLPHSYGICIDRMDWIRMYNHRTDDGVSFMAGQRVGSMFMSWMEIIERLHKVFHPSNKVIFVNNHTKRTEQLRYVDGFFDEFTYAGAPINTTALLATNKPALGWLRNDGQLKPDPDRVMQRYLYMGIFPMCPFPGNDHSISPSEFVDRVYLDYGSLLKLLRGKEWVLRPHVIELTKGRANVNIFKSFDGYTIPVVNSADEAVTVEINDEEIAKGGYRVYANYPGESEQPIELSVKINGDKIIIDAPIMRGCVVLSLSK